VVDGCKFIRVFTDPTWSGREELEEKEFTVLKKNTPGSFVMFVNCKTGLWTFCNPTREYDEPRWTVEVAWFRGQSENKEEHAKNYAQCRTGWVSIPTSGSHLTLLSSLNEYIAHLKHVKNTN
jgi:hypothetical protein